MIPFHTIEIGWISCWCPQKAHMEPVLTYVSFFQISQIIPQANKSSGDWSVPIWSRHSPKQINTIQGAAAKQDELVSFNKHQTAYSQGQKQHSTCVFQCVCKWPWPWPWPTEPPSLRWEVILYWVCLWYWSTPVSSGNF